MDPLEVDGVAVGPHGARIVVLRLAEQFTVAALLIRHRLVVVDRSALVIRHALSQTAQMILHSERSHHRSEVDVVGHGVALQFRIGTDCNDDRDKKTVRERGEL